jgi:ABC-2 type transport system permease protein
MRALLATTRAAALEAAADRRALASQALAMVVNDGVWVVFWVLFFHRAGELRGWDVESIILLQAVLTAAGGIALGLVANARRLGTLIVDGGLDPVLALPAPPLGLLLLRRIEPVNLGDLAFGVTLFAVAGHPTPTRVLLFVAVVAASATLLTGFLVLTGSLAFFAGRGESGELGFQAIVLLGSYPVDVFAGTAKLLAYTVVPAAFVSTVPARIIMDPDAGQALVLLAVAAGVAAAASLVFRAGLRRYTSGAVWTRA